MIKVATDSWKTNPLELAFSSADFMDGASEAKKKFEEMFHQLYRLIGFPPFDAKRIVRALEVFDLTPSS